MLNGKERKYLKQKLAEGELLLNSSDIKDYIFIKNIFKFFPLKQILKQIFNSFLFSMYMVYEVQYFVIKYIGTSL